MEPGDIKKEFGRRIKLFRKENDWTQEELGKKSKIHKQQISRYERGLEEPRQEILDRIVKYGGAPPDLFKVSDQASAWKIETTEHKKVIDKVRKILESENKELVEVFKTNVEGFFKITCASKNSDENKGGD